jgi:4-alpha-glucanotransferase
VSSLPGPDGIGDLGPSADAFVDFLAEAGQGWWQMLPVGPIGAGNSPYSSPSAFAGEPLFISLDLLVEDGLVSPQDLRERPAFAAGASDFEGARRFKEPLLSKAFQAFTQRGSAELWSGFKEFQKRHAGWLEDWCRFAALKQQIPGGDWADWPPEIRARDFRRWGHSSLREFGETVARHQFLQFLFHRQWDRLRSRAAARGVGLIGDVPIYVAHDSADVWANQEIFQLGADGRPTAVAGVPPDYFSEDGQLWGNPLYRWDVLKARGYDWWLARLRQASERFDAVRLDHFIGFQRYWEIPAQAKTAKAGTWKPGPAEALFEKIRADHPALELIAEDLGVVTPEVTALRERFDLPGLRVLQFAFGDDHQAQSFLPDHYPRRCLAYAGTHDNDTTAGWYANSSRPDERDRARRYLHSDGGEMHWDMIKAILGSTADTAIVTAQDLLGLGSQARMNLPGGCAGHWRWRLKPGELGADLARRLRTLTEAGGRLLETKV